VAVAVRVPESWQPPRAIDGSEIADPVASARAAGLRYVSDTMPGIRRKRSGKGFSYLAPDGGAIREAQTKENGSFGLTTLRNRHVNVHGSSIRFNFRGKGGKAHLVKVTDRRLVRIIKKCQDLPGQELFQYLGEDGEPKAVESDDVNQYLREIAGDDFTAKDFRTWSGTIAQVAEQLGNTPAVCKQCYIHPAVIAAYLAGSLKPLEDREEQDPYRLSAEERGLLRILSSAA
jgi:DNA topoisomerase-1